MSQLCIYLQLHQPWRLHPFSIFEMGQIQSYFGNETLDRNRQVFQKVAQKSYYPMLHLLEHLITTEPQFCFALSCSGVFLEQARQFEPDILNILRHLMASGRVELLAETYYHSLASLYSPTETAQQVLQHLQLLQRLFHYTPVVFRNTELVYSNDIAHLVSQLGFLGVLTEGVDRFLHGQSRSQVFASATPERLPILVKHAQLSDDIAFRFSDRNWSSYPLTAPTYLNWLDTFLEHDLVNLFMDFETFGEHQWADTGIFAFFEEVVHWAAAAQQHSFTTPARIFRSLTPIDRARLTTYDVPEPISWADIDRDTTAWRGNDLQTDTLKQIYHLEPVVLASRNPQLIADWRRLQTSDHFYYMCIKWSADGDVHAYFSPYDSPYEAYRQYCTILSDVAYRATQ